MTEATAMLQDVTAGIGAEALTLVAWMHGASWLPGTTPIGR